MYQRLPIKKLCSRLCTHQFAVPVGDDLVSVRSGLLLPLMAAVLFTALKNLFLMNLRSHVLYVRVHVNAIGQIATV